jgi:hypothetical protein
MEIEGKIIGIKYEVFLKDELQAYELLNFDINTAPSYCIVKNGTTSFTISKWVSPKRTRSYPYERVYNTLSFTKKITVIPIIKDEGKDGDRDFLQWDTVSLMSLLDVYVIFGYYEKATKNPAYENKITNFEFDNKHIKSKIKDIQKYHSSALHWNLNEINNSLHDTIDKVLRSHEYLERELEVKLHSHKGIENFKNRIGKNVSEFMEFSRDKAKKAQLREVATYQPKEKLSTDTKATIVITNFLGGKYYFTTDEVTIANKVTYLIECKHTKHNKLPSKGDIKDGLLKLVLYSNLNTVEINNKIYNCVAVLNLTSDKLLGHISSIDKTNDLKVFCVNNALTEIDIQCIELLFKEAKTNNFVVKIGNAT